MNELTLRVDKCRMQLPVCNSKIKQPQLHSDFISGYDFIGLGKLSTTCLIEHLEGIEVFCPKYKFHCRENVAVRKVLCFVNILLFMNFVISLCYSLIYNIIKNNFFDNLPRQLYVF